MFMMVREEKFLFKVYLFTRLLKHSDFLYFMNWLKAVVLGLSISSLVSGASLAQEKIEKVTSDIGSTYQAIEEDDLLTEFYSWHEKDTSTVLTIRTETAYEDETPNVVDGKKMTVQLQRWIGKGDSVQMLCEICDYNELKGDKLGKVDKLEYYTLWKKNKKGEHVQLWPMFMSKPAPDAYNPVTGETPKLVPKKECASREEANKILQLYLKKVPSLAENL